MNVGSLLDRLEAAGIRVEHPRFGENRTRCPKCDRRLDDALAVRLDHDHATWNCHRCHWSGAVGDGKRRVPQTASRKTPAVPERKDDDNARDLARAIWIEALPLAGTLGAEYLIRRGCLLPPVDGDLRFHPRLFCSKVGRALPALVGRVSTVAGNVGVGIHRIYLDPLGSDKAIAKMRLGGSAEPVCIRLFPDDAVTMGLAIAEGIESALAAATWFRPVWSTIDAGQMTVFPVLSGVESLTICADHDAAGIKAASTCMDRWRMAGREVNAVAPKQVGADMNDLVRAVAHG